MKAQEAVNFTAGGLLLLFSLLAYFIDLRYVYADLFIGLMLFQSSITKVCPMQLLFKKLGFKE